MRRGRNTPEIDLNSKSQLTQTDRSNSCIDPPTKRKRIDLVRDVARAAPVRSFERSALRR